LSKNNCFVVNKYFCFKHLKLFFLNLTINYPQSNKYVEWVDDHPRSINEFNKFVNGGHISAIRKKIQAKWQITNISNKQIVDLFQLTTFENALFGDSAMNEMFATTEDREVLEYLGDLKHYYKVC